MYKFFGTVIMVLLLVGCSDYTPPPSLSIQPVTPVATLPALPTRGAATVRSYVEARDYAAEVKTLIENAGGQLDIAANGGELDCQRYFDLYQQGAALPMLTAEVAEDALLVWAANEYNTAVTRILDAGGDTYRHCEVFLLGKATQNEIGSLAWTNARLGVTKSVNRLDALIVRMRDELPDSTTYVGTGGQVLKATRDALNWMGDLGYHLDRRSVLCSDFITTYEQMIALPEIKVTGADATVQAAYEKYRWAVDEATRTSRDQYLDCKDFMTTGLESREIPYLTWGTARKGLNDAMAALHQAEEWLKGYGK